MKRYQVWVNDKDEDGVFNTAPIRFVGTYPSVQMAMDHLDGSLDNRSSTYAIQEVDLDAIEAELFAEVGA